MGWNHKLVTTGRYYTVLDHHTVPDRPGRDGYGVNLRDATCVSHASCNYRHLSYGVSTSGWWRAEEAGQPLPGVADLVQRTCVRDGVMTWTASITHTHASCSPPHNIGVGSNLASLVLSAPHHSTSARPRRPSTCRQQHCPAAHGTGVAALPEQGTEVSVSAARPMASSRRDIYFLIRSHLGLSFLQRAKEGNFFSRMKSKSTLHCTVHTAARPWLHQRLAAKSCSLAHSCLTNHGSPRIKPGMLSGCSNSTRCNDGGMYPR
jgi:hypothetical protein